MIWFVLACGYSETKFESDVGEAVCAWAEDCGNLQALGYEDRAACEGDVAAAYVSEGCEIDRDAARACVDGIEALTCDEEPTSVAPCATACP